MIKVNVYVKLKPSLLDAQGQVVLGALKNLGFSEATECRIGKFIELEFDNSENITEKVEEMCKKLLANPNTELYNFEVVPDSVIPQGLYCYTLKSVDAKTGKQEIEPCPYYSDNDVCQYRKGPSFDPQCKTCGINLGED